LGYLPFPRLSPDSGFPRHNAAYPQVVPHLWVVETVRVC
jgi:hypothetical protein